MLLIDCPHCGPRSEVEFRCGGESHIVRPTLEDSATDERWADYLFYRDNPKGINFERWHHKGGCLKWFNIARNTLTHEIRAVYEMGAPKPDIAS